jgi:hypothetical protein
MSITLLVLFHIARAADYTGDGIDDLVVGVPYESDIGGVLQPGAVNVIPGSTSGLSPAGDLFIHQNIPHVPDSNGEQDWFGLAIAAGDVDGDGRDELIVGGRNEQIGGPTGGAVWRLELASTSGVLSVADSQLLTQDTPRVRDTAEPGDLFGTALAVADFDGDGYDDVAVGVPWEDIAGTIDVGAVAYFPGSVSGMTTAGQLFYHQDVARVAGVNAYKDYFGDQLAAGDFDGDGYADLAIGIPGDDWTGEDEGSAQVMYGSATGPGVVSPNDELWSPGQGSVAGLSQDESECGSALAVGDFDGDGYDDLAIGCPGYAIGGAPEAGAVLVVYGSASGLDGSELWSQELSGVIGEPDIGDGFGRELSSGDYDGDGYDDLAIAAPYDDFGIFVVSENCGVVNVLMGSTIGITDVDDGLLLQDSGSVVAGSPEDYEHWGQALASGDYDDDGRDDLAVGSPDDADSGQQDGGVVNVFYGSATGPAITDNDMFHQDTAGIDDAVEIYDHYGYTLR